MIVEVLQENPVLLLFSVLALGYLLGKLELFGLSFGSVGGVLLAGLVFGHFGFSADPVAQSFGFALFIFCVGYQAGPQFFEVLKTSGLKYFSLALVVAATGFALSVGFAHAFDLAPGLAAGLLGGALTTTPTLAAAQDAINTGIASIPPGFTTDTVKSNIGAAYALTYLFGLIGLVVIIRLLPRLLKFDMAYEASKLAGGQERLEPDTSRLAQRMYEVTSSTMLNRTVNELESDAMHFAKLIYLCRDGVELEVTNDTMLELGDKILLVGAPGVLLAHAADIGREIPIPDDLDLHLATAKVVVTNKQVVGQPISQVALSERLGAMPVEVRRQRRVLAWTNDLVLQRGDVVTVHGPEAALDRLSTQVGYAELNLDQTDLLTLAIGVAAGIVIGTFAITVGGISLGIGTAGGLLITGLLIGYLRSIWPVFGRVPSGARWILMELGLLMFMAGVGVNSGGQIVAVLESAGTQLIFAGMVVTTIPVLVGYLFCRKVLKLNPVEALGGIAGAMTSGAALNVIISQARNNVPALSYTGAYAFANVILTLAGTFIMLV